MTIAAGFVCADGLVIAADGEISNNIAKWEDTKVHQCIRKNYGVVISGAGDSTLLKMAVDEIDLQLAENADLQRIREIVVDVTDRLSRRCIFCYVDGDPDRPDLQLLVGARMKSGQTLLLKTEVNRICEVSGCDFVGVGHTLARTVASWLYQPQMPADVVAVIAMQIVYWVKQHVSGCGQETRVVSLVDRNRSSITLYEDRDFFWGLNELIQPILVSCIDPTVTDTQFSDRIEKFAMKMGQVRQARKIASLPFPGAPEREP
jgi:20S proteasome alpha/beta subunit